MKRIIVVRKGEKIYYKVKKRILGFLWIKYKINEYSFNHNSLKRNNTSSVDFDSKSEAELFINWKDIKYLNKYIHIGCNKNHDSIVYVVYDINKICRVFYNKIFYNIEDAKEYIESLPRTINVYDNYK